MLRRSLSSSVDTDARHVVSHVVSTASPLSEPQGVGTPQLVSGPARATHPTFTTYLVRNICAACVAGGVIAGMSTGYFSPDRPSRPQWEAMEASKTLPAGQLVYQSDFTKDQLSASGTTWGYYNGATSSMVAAGAEGVTVTFGGIAWVGAKMTMPSFVPGAIYRVSIDAEVSGEPGAVIVRNKQLDLAREPIPVGRQTTRIHFAAPPGRFDQVLFAFIGDSRSAPQGTMKIRGVKIERMGQ
jgi:hypothetical protein